MVGTSGNCKHTTGCAVNSLSQGIYGNIYALQQARYPPIYTHGDGEHMPPHWRDSMGYEINVSQNGRHLFATHERSMSNMLLEDALDMLHLMSDKFPKSEGYEVTMTECRTYRNDITPQEM